MVAQRRLKPLGLTVILGLVVIAMRTFQVQVVEHEVWAAQAASFRTSSRLVPYHRGRFLDREGRVLVADEDVASLEFVYRDFRRGNPLGLAAHARTVIEGRPVGLAETEPQVEAWCRRVASLAPAAIDAFGGGAALADADGVVLAGESPEPEVDARRARATDLRFYATALLGLSRREQGLARQRIENGEGDRPWSALAASVRRSSPESVLDSVARRATEARADLVTLASLLDDGDLLAGETGAPLARLLAHFDARRSDQEDAAADELFETATGFAAGRVPTEALAVTFELTWISRALRWDRARLDTWIATRRGEWERELDEFRLPRILARADLAEPEGARAQRLLDDLADLWRARGSHGSLERAWTDLESVTVIHEARSLFHEPRGEPLSGTEASVLPFQDEKMRDIAAIEEDPWRVVGLLFEAACLRAGLESPDANTLATRWRKLSESREGLDGAAALDELRRAARAFEADWSGAALRALAALRGPADADGHTGAPLELADARLDRAAQRERYVLVEAQSRASRVAAEPAYALVQLVARDPDRFAGFAVRETTQRVTRMSDSEGVAVAGLLIGTTRRPFLKELLARSEDERRLADLQYRLLKSEDETRELRELSTRLARADEWTGDNGLEAWFDAELRGRFGVYETEGLDAAKRGDGERLLPAIDGTDMTLTIDAKVQIAAQDVLAKPRMPLGGDTDKTWFENQVGAILLLARNGEVLAAASAPTLDGAANVPGRGHERSRARERTLQTPTFNPPGSVFKPFIAAFALDRVDFDPLTRFECRVNEKGQPMFESLRCNAHHVESDLHHALVVSCNSYFAQLGLALDPGQMLDAAREFGFGEPTGVRNGPGHDRRGLREDWVASPDFDADGMRKELASRAAHIRFPNGLGLLWASPMQVARATAGLATGTLPTVRLVRAIGGVPIAGKSRPLAISKQALDIVRAGMRGVVVESGGSGHGKGVDDATLGFSFACKTGSADIGFITEVPGMPDEDRAARAAGKSRKHTWVAGWFPAEDPIAIVVVYLHNTTETASRTAIHVAAQFLQTEAVRGLVARKGAQ